MPNNVNISDYEKIIFVNNISENNITIKSNLSADNLQEIKNLAYDIKNQLN